MDQIRPGDVIAELRGSMSRVGVTQRDLAHHLDMRPEALSKRMHGRVEFTLAEMIRAAEFVGMDLRQLLNAIPHTVTTLPAPEPGVS